MGASPGVEYHGRDIRVEKHAKYQLPLFFILAFGITWTVQIIAYVYADAHDFPISNENNLLYFQDLFASRLATEFVPFFLLFHLGFGPSVAGLIVIAIFKGRAGLRDVFRRTVKVRIPLQWILTILAIPIAWSTIALAFGFVAAGFAPITFDFLVPLGMAPFFFIYLIIFTGLSEEIGWRGYALPELQRKFSAEKSSWILGILWGLWHLPSALLVLFLHDELDIAIVSVTLLGLTFGIVGWTIVITWIYNNTQSVFWVILLHGLTNLVQSYLVLSSSSQAAMGIWALIPWAFAIFLLKRYGGKTLTGIFPPDEPPHKTGSSASGVRG